jgi:RNA polymerase sigma-70 factor, ECF subfamily
MTSSHEITALLRRWSEGQPRAEAEVMRVVLPELRRLARRHLRRERPNHTLQPTALINEAYIQLAGNGPMQWRDRSHFFALAARLMRNVLVDHARRRLRAKRRGEVLSMTLDEHLDVRLETPEEIVSLNDALDALRELDARRADVVELRFFGGLSAEETAAALNISRNTVQRDWSLARAWLLRQIDRRSKTRKRGPLRDDK